MTHRTDRVRLPPGEALCQPSLPCKQKGSCARHQAAVPALNARLEDYSLSQIVMFGGALGCKKYLSQAATMLPAPAAAPAPKPYLKGLT